MPAGSSFSMLAQTSKVLWCPGGLVPCSRLIQDKWPPPMSLSEHLRWKHRRSQGQIEIWQTVEWHLVKWRMGKDGPGRGSRWFFSSCMSRCFCWLRQALWLHLRISLVFQCNVTLFHDRTQIDIYIYDVKLLSGPSLGILGVIIWAK